MLNFIEIDLAISLIIQQFTAFTVPVMRLFSALGGLSVYILLITLITWCVHYKAGIYLGILTSIAGGLNSSLKNIVRLPRPYHISEEIIAYKTYSGFGMPSGHAQNAAMFWGLSFQRIKSNTARIVFVFLAFVIGLSRIVLGVHSFAQVILGWAIGVLLLFSFLAIEKKFDGEKSITIFSIILLPVLAIVSVVTMLVYGDFTGAEALTAITDYDILAPQYAHGTEVTLTLGAAAGFLIGYLLLTKKYIVKVRTIWWKQAIKTAAALAVLLAYDLLSGLLERIPNYYLYSLSLLGASFLFGIAITFLVPLLFGKLGLMDLSKKKDSAI
ncbi:MAG: phosphatase PAP2 family protein [Spirochaetia bacterium]